MTTVVQLRRFNTSQPWGFKMQGGVDVGSPLFAAHVSPNSISGHAGLKAGDAILKIGSVDAMSFTHEQARGEMIRCGNEIDLTVQRGVVASPLSEVVQEETPRMSVSEDGGPYQEVTTKTFKKMEEEQAAGARPASIFDKKRQKRSEYTKADTCGYMKALGEK